MPDLSQEAAIGARAARFIAEREPSLAEATVRGVERLGGGYSRQMRILTLERGGEVVRFVLRSDPAPGTAMIDTDRATEWAVVRALTLARQVAVPAARWFDAAGEICGTPTIVFEHIDAPSCARSTRTDLASCVGRLAARVHSVDPATLSHTLTAEASWDDYVSARVASLREAESRFPSRNAIVRYLAAWLDDQRPAPLPLRLVHGDFQLANMLDHGSLVLVDWELARFGDPREDLGYLALVGAQSNPNPIAGQEALVLAAYRDAAGYDVDVVNPQTVAYFTVLSAIDGFTRLLHQLGSAIEGDRLSTPLAYAAVGSMALHGILMGAVGVAEGVG